jgi:nucleotide-binding universal stress UspA family protein
MAIIVCATRGGEDSRRTQECAIEMARARGDELVFVFVADATLTPPGREVLSDVVADELARLGRRLLGIARARAQEQGVSAQIVVRNGPFRQTLMDLLAELNAAVLVMGAPHPHANSRAVSSDTMQEVSDEVRAMGIEVVVVE